MRPAISPLPPAPSRRALPKGTLPVWGLAGAALIAALSVRILHAREHAPAPHQVSMHDAALSLEEKLAPVSGARRAALTLRYAQDANPALRYASIDALAEHPSPAVLDIIEQDFTDPASEVRKRALEKLIDVDGHGVRGLRLLLAGLRDEDSWIREDAAGQINLRIGRRGSVVDKRAVPTLITAVSDEDANVAATASRALSKLTGQSWKFSVLTPPAQRREAAVKWRAWWQGAAKAWPIPPDFRVIAPRPPARSDAAPAFAIEDVTGQSVRSEDLKGRITLINFWATWCGPCKAETADLIKVHETYKDRNVAVIGMACSEKSKSGLTDWCRENHVSYRQVMADTEVRAAFGDIEEVPVSFLIDAQGRIRRRWDGERDFATFQAAIERLLREPQGAAK